MYTSVVRTLQVQAAQCWPAPQWDLLTPTYSPRVRAQGIVRPVVGLHQGRLADVICWLEFCSPVLTLHAPLHCIFFHSLFFSAILSPPCDFWSSSVLCVTFCLDSHVLHSLSWDPVAGTVAVDPVVLPHLVCKCRRLLTYFLISWKNLYFLELYKWYRIMWTFSGGSFFNWAQLILESCIL